MSRLTVRKHFETKSMVVTMQPKGVPCFTPELLQDLSEVPIAVANQCGIPEQIRFTVLRSGIPGVFCYGGDIEKFAMWAEAQDGTSLYEYGKLCVRNVLTHTNAMGLPKALSIALVQGDALGGGWETALSANIVIAEKSAKFAFPEVIFGTIPGMGAFPFISQRIGRKKAEDIVLSGASYTGRELYAMGLIDVLAEDGKGFERTVDYMKAWLARFDTLYATVQMRKIGYGNVTEDALMRGLEIWIDSVLSMSESNLRKIKTLAKAQKRKFDESA